MSLRVFKIIKRFIIPAILLTGLANAQIPCLSGFVYDPDGQVVVDADLDFDDALTGERMYTPGDNTDDYGFYRVCIIPGLYNITFSPPLGTHLMSKRFFNFSLQQSQVLNVTLNRGLVVSGVVRNQSGTPVFDVDLDVDSLGEGRVYTSDDNSDSNGIYWVVIPPGAFRIRYTPPPGSRLRGLEIDSLIAEGDTTIDVTLLTGVSLSGRITDPQGDGLPNVDIDLRERESGAKIFIPYNKSDSSGRYSVVAPTGMFNLRFAPPSGSRYVGVELDSFAITGDLTLNQTLESGMVVTCLVHDSSGTPLQNADLDFTETATGMRVFTPNDKTDPNGISVVTVFPNIYTIRVDPPPGTILDRLTIDSVRIASDTSFDFLLPEISRVTFSGRVTNRSGAGLADVEIGIMIPRTETAVSLHNNDTDASGYFDIHVPLGNFDLYFSPSEGSRYVGKKIEGVTFESDTSWSEIALDSGLLFGAQVFNSSGFPVGSVNFDFIPDGGSEPVFAAHDISDSDGVMQTAVLPGRYSIRLTPPEGSGFGNQLFDGYNIESDTTVIFLLSDGRGEIPAFFVLHQNYPNPFNKNTAISYTLFEGSDVSIIFYNALGRHVTTRIMGYQRPGFYITYWDGKNSDGRPVASGLYFYQLATSRGKDIKKMLLVR